MSDQTEEKKFPVIEIFGPVIQGEGVMAGHQTNFLRLGGCDYRCSWCDTMYAVDPDQVKENSTMMSTNEIIAGLVDLHNKYPVATVTISGGNPCMHKIDGVIHMLNEARWEIVVETQGTLWQDWLLGCALVTISPKPPSSSMLFVEARELQLQSMIIKLLSAQISICMKF